MCRKNPSSLFEKYKQLIFFDNRLLNYKKFNMHTLVYKSEGKNYGRHKTNCY